MKQKVTTIFYLQYYILIYAFERLKAMCIKAIISKYDTPANGKKAMTDYTIMDYTNKNLFLAADKPQICGGKCRVGFVRHQNRRSCSQLSTTSLQADLHSSL